ncbi:MAG: hypothetical protein ACRYFZ_01725 [Janthinobacterium lividum]
MVRAASTPPLVVLPSVHLLQEDGPFTAQLNALFEYTLPTNDMAPSLTQGSHVSLRQVTLPEVSVGDVLLRVYCTPTRRKVLELGRLQVPRHAELYQHGFITLTRDCDGKTWFDNVPWDLPNVYWFRVEQVLRIARPAPYWPTVPATAWQGVTHAHAA